MLHDQDGKLFKLSSLRGKAVFLTFVYAHCPDVCPLMMQALGAAKRSLQDPVEHADRRRLRRSQGRYAEGRSRSSCAARELTGKARWLLGTRAQLAPGLDRVQHPRQVGARDARDHRARLADLRHRRDAAASASAIRRRRSAVAWITHDARILARAK